MPEPRLVERLVAAAPLLRPATGAAAGTVDWVSAAARRPGTGPDAVRAALARVASVRDAVLLPGGLVGVRVRDDALADSLDEPLPAVGALPAPFPDVPAAFAAATGRDRARFEARTPANPAYAALVACDRARRGWPVPAERALVVLLADLPRVLAEADDGRSHRLVDWLGGTAGLVLAAGSRPPGAAAVPVREPADVAARTAATMSLALRRLGVPDIERL